jgi:hypothetical protein
MKTTVFKSLKHYTFLLLAVLISFVGIAKTAQSHLITNSMSVSKIPSFGVLIQVNKTAALAKKCNVIDLGSKHYFPPGPSSYITIGRYTSGGLSSYALIENINFSNKIGGRGAGVGTGQKSLNIGITSIIDIGGRNTGGELVVDIGGRSQDPPLFIIAPNGGSIASVRVYS